MKKESHYAVVILLACVALVSFWQVMAWRAQRGFEAFRITAKTLADFDPHIEGYTLIPLLVRDDPLEPNIISYHARPNARRGMERAALNQTILVRLAHGYNMVDCMRIKHFQVEAREEHRAADPADPTKAETGQAGDYPRQAWTLTSPINDLSLWITSMHGSEDLVPLDMDTRSMPFPKIGTPDDPSWKPSGLGLRSFHRPLYNLKRLLRARWNNARCDLLTFLRLRRPVYASDEILTLVSTVTLPPTNEANPSRIAEDLARLQEQVHAGMVRELMAYRAQAKP